MPMSFLIHQWESQKRFGSKEEMELSHKDCWQHWARWPNIVNKDGVIGHRGRLDIHENVFFEFLWHLFSGPDF